MLIVTRQNIFRSVISPHPPILSEAPVTLCFPCMQYITLSSVLTNTDYYSTEFNPEHTFPLYDSRLSFTTLHLHC